LPAERGSEAWISALLDAAAPAQLMIYADPARGTFRYASMAGPRLDACLFIAKTKSSLPSRDTLAAVLGAHIEPDARASILAGSSAAANAAGPTICACFGVGLHTLHEAIACGRATSVGEIGRALRAGTNCGSCIPELKAILNSTQAPAAAPA
jgi:assimilatory nitrate reductase catalytic subunit